MERLLIHIGFPKTGTTWLQNELFVSGNNVFEPLSRIDAGPSTLVNNFIKDKEGYWLSSFAFDKQQVIKECLSILSGKKNVSEKIFVFSSEQISGNLHSSGFDAKINAERIKEVFPYAQILIVIREQKSFLVSNYFQYLSKGGVHNFKKYFNIKSNKHLTFSPHPINYLPIIQYYYQLFGTENVLVLPYEMFQESHEKFIKNISDFIGEKIILNEEKYKVNYNKKVNYFTMYHFRFFNYFLWCNSLNNYSSWNNRISNKIITWFLKFLSLCIPNQWNKQTIKKITTYTEKWVSNRYEDNNKKLSKLIGIDLSKYGYFEQKIQ